MNTDQKQNSKCPFCGKVPNVSPIGSIYCGTDTCRLWTIPFSWVQWNVRKVVQNSLRPSESPISANNVEPEQKYVPTPSWAIDAAKAALSKFSAAQSSAVSIISFAEIIASHAPRPAPSLVEAVKAAATEAITNVDAVSKVMNGPRFLFHELIEETNGIILKHLAWQTNQEDKSACRCGRSLINNGDDPWCSGCVMSAKVCDCIPLSQPPATPPNTSQQIAELRSAGWVEKTHTIWKSPTGSLHLGPHGAWKTMKSATPPTEKGR